MDVLELELDDLSLGASRGTPCYVVQLSPENAAATRIQPVRYMQSQVFLHAAAEFTRCRTQLLPHQLICQLHLPDSPHLHCCLAVYSWCRLYKLLLWEAALMASSDDRQLGSWQPPSWLYKPAKALPAQQARPACHLQSCITALQVPQH